MPNSRNAQPAGYRHRIIFGSPENPFRNRILKAKPFRAWRGIPVPIQPRMVRENLNSRTHDAQHQEQVEHVRKAQPHRESFICNRAGRLARIARDEFLHGGQQGQLVRYSRCQNQPDESYWKQPQNTEPPLANSDVRDDSITRRRPLLALHLVVSASYLRFKRISIFRCWVFHPEIPLPVVAIDSTQCMSKPMQWGWAA